MKNRLISKLLCLSLSALTVISFSSCGAETEIKPSKTNENGKDIILYTGIQEETTEKKGLFKKKNDDSKKDKEVINDERVFCSDKKYFAVKSSVKGDESKFVIEVYYGETNELSAQFVPSKDFTEFKWAEDSYKIVTYKGEKAVQAYKLNDQTDKWEQCRT